MNLSKKKKLAMKTFNVGSGKIVFLESRLDEIKDAITKQDIRDLEKSGAIIIKENKGRKTVKRIISRSIGNIRKKARKKKREYIIITRKLRRYLKELHSKGKIPKGELSDIRKRIRNREFRSKSHFNEIIGGTK